MAGRGWPRSRLTTPASPTEILRLEDAGRIRSLLAGDLSNLSETSFANLYLFRNVHEYRFIDGDLPHIVGRTYDGASHVTPVGSLAGREDMALALLEAGASLYPIDDDKLAGFRDRVEVATNEADWDYVYDAVAMAALSGRRARGKRSQAARFEEGAAPVLATLDGRDPTATADALSVLDGWMADTRKDWADSDYSACREGLEHAETLGLWGFVVRSRGRPCGFLLADRLPGGAVCVHFAKGRRDEAGIFPFMFSRLAAQVGSGLLNFEQDLGNPGFRQSKLAYDPVTRLRKHRLKPRKDVFA